METLTTCPRGHALAEGAVYCTTCWIRVSPEDRAAVPARRRRRRMIVAIPLIGAASIAVGVIVGAFVANAPGDAAAPIAAPQPSVAVSTIRDAPAEQPVAIAVAPLAATVPKPVEDPAATGCVAAVRGTDVPCTLTGGRLEFTLCVPMATTVIRVGTRPDDTAKFQDASSDVSVGGQSSCAAGEITATVGIDSYSPAVTWRVVGRDAADEKIWKSRVVTAAPAP